MKAAVIYARVSSREQQEEGYSIEAQLKLLREYASKNGFTKPVEFVDVESAKTTGRKHFGEMVAFLKHSRKCTVVLVEKTDRLYRNLRDAVTLQELDLEIHLVKENEVISKNSKSHAKFVHGLRLLMAKNYSDNLKEEVKKGMAEKCEQGIFPGHAPFGYVNNRSTRTVEIHPEESEIVKLIFTTYATGRYSLSELRNIIRTQTGKTISKSYLNTILRSHFYVGVFEWGGTKYSGKHDTYISQNLFNSVQAVLDGHNRPRYQKHDLAFRGLLTCAHDGCTVTAELKKEKYVYYRCSGYRGKCDLPRFREAEISERLGTILENIRIPDEVLARIQETLKREQAGMRNSTAQQKQKLEQRLADIRRRTDQMYEEKLDGKIPEDFWQRKSAEWRADEQQIQFAINGLEEHSESDRLLDVQRILELANKASFLYVTQKPAEQAELLRKVLLNCCIDGASLTPTYRKPFDMIFERAKKQEWSGRLDSNQRPPAPKAGALPGCATPRLPQL
jgi:site-specific DNA recombinase